MERWAHRVLPYWSIAINVLLCLTLLAGAGSADAAQYGRKYAGWIFTASQTLLTP